MLQRHSTSLKFVRPAVFLIQATKKSRADLVIGPAHIERNFIEPPDDARWPNYAKLQLTSPILEERLRRHLRLAMR